MRCSNEIFINFNFFLSKIFISPKRKGELKLSCLQQEMRLQEGNMSREEKNYTQNFVGFFFITTHIHDIFSLATKSAYKFSYTVVSFFFVFFFLFHKLNNVAHACPSRFHRFSWFRRRLS